MQHLHLRAHLLHSIYYYRFDKLSSKRKLNVFIDHLFDLRNSFSDSKGRRYFFVVSWPRNQNVFDSIDVKLAKIKQSNCDDASFQSTVLLIQS